MERVAVLASGGLDSSVLLADLAQNALVYPLYVAAGLHWEAQEQRALEAFVAALGSPNVQPVTILGVSALPLYGDHWSLTARGVPDARTSDRSLYLPGRNVLLFGLAAVWGSTHGVSRFAIGSLQGNPFPDATAEFFGAFAQVLSQALEQEVRIEAPYQGMHKEELVRRSAHLPLELTLTCAAPRDGLHCGVCNKCGERSAAFSRAGVADYTIYAHRA